MKDDVIKLKKNVFSNFKRGSYQFSGVVKNDSLS